MGRNHFLSGAAVWLPGCAAASVCGWEPSGAVLVLGTAACALGAVLPDIDHPDSTVAHGPTVAARHVRRAGRSLGVPYAVRRAVTAVGWALSLATRAVAIAVNRLLGHRGATHAIPVAVAGTVVWTLLAVVAFGWPWWWVGTAVGLGTVVHIAGDWATISGVPAGWPFAPLSRRFRSPWPFRTGGAVEERVVRPALWAVTGLAVLVLIAI